MAVLVQGGEVLSTDAGSHHHVDDRRRSNLERARDGAVADDLWFSAEPELEPQLVQRAEWLGRQLVEFERGETEVIRDAWSRELAIELVAHELIPRVDVPLCVGSAGRHGEHRLGEIESSCRFGDTSVQSPQPDRSAVNWPVYCTCERTRNRHRLTQVHGRDIESCGQARCFVRRCLSHTAHELSDRTGWNATELRQRARSETTRSDEVAEDHRLLGDNGDPRSFAELVEPSE